MAKSREQDLIPAGKAINSCQSSWPKIPADKVHGVSGMSRIVAILMLALVIRLLDRAVTGQAAVFAQVACHFSHRL